MSIGIFVSPSIGTQIRQHIPSGEIRIKNHVFSETIFDESSFAYSTGVSVTKKLGERFQLTSGFSFSKFSFKTDIRREEIRDAGGARYFSSAEGTMNYYYAGIPLGINYLPFLEQGRVFLNFSFTNYYLTTTQFDAFAPVDYRGGARLQISGRHRARLPLHKYNLSAKLGIGYTIVRTQRTQITLQPHAELMLRKITEDIEHDDQFLQLISESLDERNLLNIGIRVHWSYRI